jgi:hypothetical protein
MIPLRSPRLVKCAILCGAFLLLVTGNSSATVLRTTTRSGNTSVGPSAGLGTLSYSVTDRLITCNNTNQFFSTYEVWSFGSFVYVDGSGVSHTMSGSAGFFRSNGISPPCPGNGGDPSTLTGDGLTITFVPDAGVGTATLVPISGHINPKYIIIAVTYAPPGAQSSVDYRASTLFGTSTSISDSFTKENTVKITASGTGGDIPGFKVEGSVSYSNKWTEVQDTSSSISLNKTTEQSLVVPGPASSLGINHDYDVIWLWLNPLALFDILPGPDTITWTGYAYDESDMPAMDVYPVYVGYLNGHFAMRSDIAQVLARSWATGQDWGSGGGPGLTAQDFAMILTADPFADPSYTVSVPAGSLTSSDGRFTVTNNQNISYVPPPPNGNPITQGYSVSYETTQEQGQGSEKTHEIEWSYDLSVSVGFKTRFTPSFTLDAQHTHTYSVTSKWSTTRKNTTTQSAALSVTGPAATDNYTGPTEFLVFQDNIYGTFMFYPVR